MDDGPCAGVLALFVARGVLASLTSSPHEAATCRRITALTLVVVVCGCIQPKADPGRRRVRIVSHFPSFPPTTRAFASLPQSRSLTPANTSAAVPGCAQLHRRSSDRPAASAAAAAAVAATASFPASLRRPVARSSKPADRNEFDYRRPTADRGP
jgi:hypothetical protein